MTRQRQRGRGRLLSVLGATLVTLGGVAVPTGATAPDPPRWAEELAEPQGTPGAVPWRDSTSVPLSKSAPSAPQPAAFPPARGWDVVLGAKGEATQDVPVAVKGGARSTDGGLMRVEVLDRTAARNAGVSGFLFRISEVDAGTAEQRKVLTRAAGREGVPAELSVDYASFAGAYGADYGARLQVVALPDCALIRPVPAGCDPAGVRLPSTNDLAGRKLTVTVPDLAALAADARVDAASLGLEDRSGPAAGDSGPATSGSGPAAGDRGSAVFAVMAAPGGDPGTFAASSMGATGSWNASPGAGSFTYSYPFTLPAPGAGTAPALGLGYSSASVDGLTVATNPQAGPVGLGWGDIPGGFVERGFEPCFASQNLRLRTGDLCWKGANATLSLNGVSGRLLPVSGSDGEYRLESDPGWKIERLWDATAAPGTAVHRGEHWKVTATDGTVYFFGFGHMPGRYTASVLGVTVVADDPGEPCRAAGDTIGSCRQGWRWYLDRVIDPDGNVQSYLYQPETNHYKPLNGYGNPANSKYDRGAWLKEIIYGGRGWDANSYSARVTFGTQYRCVYLHPNCPEPTKDHGGFLDVPTDLICAASDTCTTYSPAFFSGVRYAHALAEVKVGTAWKPVVQYNLIHRFPDGTAGEARKLELAAIQHAGVAFGGLMAYPDTTFGYHTLDNRADNAAHIPTAMRHNRLDVITTPFGGRTTVSYGFNRKCPNPQPPAPSPGPHWDNHTMDCFPQEVYDGGTERTGTYHKWLVTKVEEDPGDGGPKATTSYAYEGDPAWAFDHGSFARNRQLWGWSQWRGYGSVLVTRGGSKSRITSFRGWDGDALAVDDGSGNIGPKHGERRVGVRASDGRLFTDHRILAGRTLEESGLGEQAGQVLQSTIYGYERRTTVDAPPTHLYDAEWAGVTEITERVAAGPGAFQERRSRMSYTGDAMTPPQPSRTLEEGWLHVTGDERCSITTYAVNRDRWMFAYPASNRMLAGNCDSTEVLSASETRYDGSATTGEPPTRGNPTRRRTMIDASTWSETATEFDVLGRPTKVTAPRGAATTTAYTVTAGAPAGQIPIRTTVTNALGHTTITDLHPEFGIPSATLDANNNRTSYTYDAFGRTTGVRLPTEQCTTSPCEDASRSWQFSYDVATRSVRSRQRVGGSLDSGKDAVHQDSWAVHDGFWRPRQTQALSPASGKVLVAETTYDNRGNVRDETVEQAVTGSPGTYLAGIGWKNATRHLYDTLGRETEVQWLRSGTPAHSTRSSYGVDTVEVTGPEGSRVRQRVDGLGRTVEVAEHDGQGWATAGYAFDLADRLRTVTDPEGNRIRYEYNLAGWRTSQTDPDRGSATFGYDLAGNLTRATDGSGATIETAYDALGRRIERRSGSRVLASWTYDGATLGKGLPHTSVSTSAEGAWTTQVTGYDKRSRALGGRLTVPSGLPGLTGTYETSQTYDRADRVTSVTHPAVGGLAGETVTTAYTSLGLATSMKGLQTYVRQTNYDDRGRRSAAAFGSKQVLQGWMLKSWAYDPLDQRLASTEVLVENGGAYRQTARHELTYDAEGTVVERAGTLNGAQRRECYDHDPRGRLVEAYTVARTATCADGTPGTGDQPYSHSYRFSPAGRMTERVEQGTRTAYAYPPSGGARPHAPTSAGGTSYQWDDRGNLASRSTGGRTETFSWDVQGLLTSVSGGGGSTSFAYGASGQRLLRRTSTGSTLYLPGHEVTASADGGTVSAVRSYTFDGELVATRGPGGVDFVTGDPAGSVEAAIPDGGAPTATRAYDPYGGVRAQTGDLATDQGFLGQIEDATTSLSYLNARYYDTASAIFISTDPLYSTTTPASLNPYGYSTGDPVSFSDASGLTPSYSYGLEQQNAALRHQNQQLTGYVTQLLGHIDGLQRIIRDQDRAINNLLTHISALHSFIRQQETIIRHLSARVAQLQAQVAYWKGRAQYWYGRAVHWRSQAYYWQGRYNYLRFQVVEPTFRRIYGSGADAQLAAVDAMTWTAASLPCFCTRDRPNPLRNHFNEDPPRREPLGPPVRWIPGGYIMGPPPGTLDNQFNVDTFPTGLGTRYERVPPNLWRFEPNRTLIDAETACDLVDISGVADGAKQIATRGKGNPWVTGSMIAATVACKFAGH
ncbi:RHS repeat-associated core domain-containing protein [Nonomuraea sp. NPDC050663]|uniref:RHS repeat-associated core domain-containing protein n=1 Tax=Nonomuraea sp. NPDC050663 TaxID=3364370 RepID=UPI0037A0A827